MNCPPDTLCSLRYSGKCPVEKGEECSIVPFLLEQERIKEIPQRFKIWKEELKGKAEGY